MRPTPAVNGQQQIVRLGHFSDVTGCWRRLLHATPPKPCLEAVKDRPDNAEFVVATRGHDDTLDEGPATGLGPAQLAERVGPNHMRSIPFKPLQKAC